MQPVKAEASRHAPEPKRPDPAELAKRFFEPLRGEEPPKPHRPGVPQPTLIAAADRFRQPQPEPSPDKPQGPPEAETSHGLRSAIVSALVVLALVPLAVLFVRLWQDTMSPSAGAGAVPASEQAASSATAETITARPAPQPKALEVALSSPERIEAKGGETIAFPIAIDATEALPARSIVTVAALPEGAAFSAGRPYGVTGWSLRPDEIGDLQLRLPARSGSTDLRLELVAGDGTVLAQSETRLAIAPAPAGTAPDAAVASASSNPGAADDVTGSIGAAPSALQPPASAAAPAVRVNTVKVVTIPVPEALPAPPTPHPSRPHDGGYGLGPAAEEPQAQEEWMVTKAPVDMHAKAAQSAPTVKVAEKGLKLKVVAREKNWVKVTDPKTSTTGWIYNRFLAPAATAAQ